LYGLSISRPSSVLVVGSAPADLDFWQAAKAIFNCQAAVEEGGWLVLVTPCQVGIPEEHRAFDRAIGLEPEQIEGLLSRLEGGEARGAAVDRDLDRVTLAPALALARFRRRIRIAVVSPGLTPAQVGRMGFSWFGTVEEALESILEDLPEAKRRVDVVTHGGSTYPCIAPGSEKEISTEAKRSSR
jgi:nickel-dependent lactate racemase